MRFLPAIFWMAFIYYLSGRSSLPHPPGAWAALFFHAAHAVVYAILSMLLAYGFSASRMTLRARLFLVVLLAVAYGITDEIHQSRVLGRTASVLDVGVDAIGATVGALAVYFHARRNLIAVGRPRRATAGSGQPPVHRPPSVERS